MIFWRGFGIGVAIIFFISAWLTSYSFEDTRLGNGAYMGWSMIWAALPTLLLWLGLRGSSQKEKELEPGEIPVKKSKYFTGHSFMFIPVVFWPLIFAVLGFYFVSKSDDSSTNEDFSEVREEVTPKEVLEGERIINFWNPNDDTVSIETFYIDTDESRMTETIPPKYVRYATYKADYYRFEYLDYDDEITVRGAEELDSNSYNQSWYVLSKELDLLLVDVTAVCNTTINREGIQEIDWSKKIKERYNGRGLIEPVLNANGRSIKYSVVDPGFTLPTTLDENEKVYSLIPIYSEDEATDAYLDSMVVNICY